MFASPERKGFSQTTAPSRRIRLTPSTCSGGGPTSSSGPSAAWRSFEWASQQVILTLGDVVAELVGEAKPEAVRRTVGTDQIDAGELRLLAAVRCKVGRSRVGWPGRDQLRTVALVEPFGLTAGLSFRRLAAVDSVEEHAHRIRLLLRRRRAMHSVARVGRPEMRQAGAGHDQVRRVLVVDRRDDPARRELRHGIDLLPQAELGNHLGKTAAGHNALQRELTRGFNAVHKPR